jgi:hypothetical protein
MAQITINIPDGVLPRVIDALAIDYSPTLPDGTPNPMTKNQYAKKQVLDFVKERVKRVEAQIAREEAERQAKESVDEDVQLS